MQKTLWLLMLDIVSKSVSEVDFKKGLLKLALH